MFERPQHSLRELIQFSPLAIEELDPEGKVKLWNTAAEQMFGWRECEVLGRAYPAIPAESRAEFEDEMRHVLNGATIQSKLVRRQRKDGQQFDARLWAAPIHNQRNQVIGITKILEDVTAQKAAEERLLLQSTVLQATANSIVITDDQGTILWTNSAFSQLTGYGSEEVLGKNPRLLKSGKQDSALYTNMWATITSGNVWHGEVVNRKKDGNLYNEEMTITPVHISNGGITHYVAVKQDVTLRRVAEEALRQAEMQYRFLFENNPLPMWVFDRKTLKFLAVNEAAIRHYGFSRQEFLSMTTADIRPEEDIPRLLKATAQPIHGLREVTLWRHRKKDGSIIDVEIVSHELDFHGIQAELVAPRDVTERKKAERALRRSEEYLAFAQGMTGVGSWVWNPSTTEIRYWSQENYRIWDIEGAISFEKALERIHPEDRLAHSQAVERAIREKTDFELDFRLIQRDGSIRYIHSIARERISEGDGHVEWIGAHIDFTERERAQAALRQSEERYRALFERSLDCVYIADFEGHFLDANQATLDLLGYRIEDVLGLTFESLLTEDQLPTALKAVDEILATGRQQNPIEYRLRGKDGRYIFVETQASLIERDGKPFAIQGIARDITERKLAEEALRRAEEKYRAIVDDAIVGIFQGTPEGRPVSVNRALARMHGYDSPEQLMAEVSNVGRQLFVDPNALQELGHMLEKDRVLRNVELEIYDKDGIKKWVSANVRVVTDIDGKVVLHEGTVEDITVRKAAENQAQFLSFYDVLTGLPNRALLRDRIIVALLNARQRGEKVALLFLDLDRFKIINDSLGHSIGDLLLKQVAQRLKRWVQEQDTVAHMGGDEFLILLTGIKEIADAVAVAERVVKSMASEFVIPSHSLNITCSLGISIFPDHGGDAETLIRHADQAMYSAKEKGGNNFQLFKPGMSVEATARMTLESSLRLAVAKKEFFLEYQPQLDLATGQITGCEALIRWRHPELGLVLPNKFIPVAESSGLIGPIGEWVLKTACAQARQWQDDGLSRVPVAVNVSALQFRQEGFVELIKTVLQETGLAPEFLDLELTESMLLTDAEVMLSRLQQLRAMGVKLTIDDFGTGYSSFNYLKHFQVHKLKIDRSFMRDVMISQGDAAIAVTIIIMAKSLGLRVLAEGVENEEQVSFLRSHNCDEIQGNSFSQPLPAAEFADKLRGLPHKSDAGLATGHR
jgi:diguanylate cyclase (GGDEF)-like protein/PAS domain S-box-containing protein